MLVIDHENAELYEIENLTKSKFNLLFGECYEGEIAGKFIYDKLEKYAQTSLKVFDYFTLKPYRLYVSMADAITVRYSVAGSNDPYYEMIKEVLPNDRNLTVFLVEEPW